MKRALLIIISALLLMGFTACGQSTTPLMPDQSEIGRTAVIVPDYYFGYKTVPLIVGQDDGSLGDVAVYIDENNLYFDVALTEEAQAAGWWISETHVAVYTSLDEFPLTKKGNPKVGQYAESIDLPVEIIWDAGTILYISVHASLQRIVNGEVVQDETGWGEGTQFDGNSWAMYFTYEVWKNPPLPPAGEAVDFTIYPATDSYIDTTIHSGLEDNPGDWAVWNGVWDGWCVDKYHTIYYPNVHYTGYLYSSYYQGDWPNNDPRFNKDWCRINYVLNDPNGIGASAKAVQAVIWYYTDGLGLDDLDSDELPADTGKYYDLLADAEANGGGFLPGSGQVFLVLFYVNSTVQLTGIEVDP